MSVHTRPRSYCITSIISTSVHSWDDYLIDMREKGSSILSILQALVIVCHEFKTPSGTENNGNFATTKDVMLK